MPVIKKQVKKAGTDSVKANPLQKTQKFLRSVVSEMKKVHWPTNKQAVIYTGVVVISVLVVALLLFVVDQMLSFILQPIVSR